MAANQFVYFMDGVSKTYPGGKKVFENIRLCLAAAGATFRDVVKINVYSTDMQAAVSVDDQFLAVDQVERPARGPHYDLGTTADSADLVAGTGTAVDGYHIDAFAEAGEFGQVAGDLQAELAGRTEDERLHGVQFRVNTVYYGQTETRRLTGTGTRECDEVAVGIEDRGDRLRLYGRGGFEAQLRHGAFDLLPEVQFTEIFHFTNFIRAKWPTTIGFLEAPGAGPQPPA